MSKEELKQKIIALFNIYENNDTKNASMTLLELSDIVTELEEYVENKIDNYYIAMDISSRC
jgi:hypothetical protein